MIKNYYYLIAGIVAILFSIALAWNGQTNILPSLNVPTITGATKTIFFYVWHINTAENMLFGITFLIMSIHKDLSKVRFTAWVIAITMIVRGLVMVGGIFLSNAEGLKSIVIELIVFGFYVWLILLGVRVKDRYIHK